MVRKLGRLSRGEGDYNLPMKPQQPEEECVTYQVCLLCLKPWPCTNHCQLVALRPAHIVRTGEGDGGAFMLFDPRDYRIVQRR